MKSIAGFEPFLFFVFMILVFKMCESIKSKFVTHLRWNKGD